MDCYNSFRPILNETLEGMHPGLHHQGKVPVLALTRLGSEDRIQTIERSLRDAVDAEDYEEAARFRDELAALRSEDATNRKFLDPNS